MNEIIFMIEDFILMNITQINKFRSFLIVNKENFNQLIQYVKYHFKLNRKYLANLQNYKTQLTFLNDFSKTI